MPRESRIVKRGNGDFHQVYRPCRISEVYGQDEIKQVIRKCLDEDILPHGIWEMGRDSKGMIVTTNTIEDLASWQTHMVTQKCIELGGEYIRSVFVEVNKKGLLDAIKLYEESFSGKEKYSFHNLKTRGVSFDSLSLGDRIILLEEEINKLMEEVE